MDRSQDRYEDRYGDTRHGAPARPGLARRPVLLGAALSLAALAIGPAPAASRPGPARRLDPDRSLAFFDAVALRLNNPCGPAKPRWVRKWTGPVWVRVTGNPGARRLAETRHILATLQGWTGVPFRLTRRAVAGGNRTTIHFLDHAAMEARYGVGGPLCHCATYGNGGRLHTGIIEVSNPYASCLRHELMHGLGFDNHWTGPLAGAGMPSVLAGRGAEARSPDFSVWDEMAVRTLYDPRLIPGMPYDRALATARGILSGSPTS